LAGRYHKCIVSSFIQVDTLQGLKESNLNFLKNQAFCVFPTSARHVEEGVWISRGVSIHPTAKIHSPVFIGEFCQINKDAVIGPNTVVENYCIVDSESDIANSVVCSCSYIGEELTVDDCIVDRKTLINLALDSHVTIEEDFILGESYPSAPCSWFFKLFEKLVAAVLFVLFFPFYLAMHWNHHVRSQKMLKLPASYEPALWQTFDWVVFELDEGRPSNLFHRLFYRLPLLWGILQGDIHFVGVKPRTIEEVEKLPEDWMKLYLRSKVGIINVSDLENGDQAERDDCYATESLYASHKGLFYDIRWIIGWIFQKIRNQWKGR
jgi:acetyltransferase-like isoleucine patch superfamily enzyme